MPTKYPTVGIAFKYFLLQVPSLILLAAILWWARKWFGLPGSLVWLILLIWVGKDVLLFPLLWRYYDSKQLSDHFEMVGRQGIALNDLNPEGYVKINAERWKAVNSDADAAVTAGDKVYVKAVNGLTLEVGPLPADNKKINKSVG
jgi:membrane protein implicated in regulation of membrane protease activity